jgi:hypothetical protein
MRGLNLERSRITFVEKMDTKDPKAQDAYKTALNNFENFCMEKHGKEKRKNDSR